VVFGGITQKKRGILGVGNNSFDKRFIFDQRLLTLAPPMFPASVNVVVKTQMPFSPDSNNTERALRYVKGTGFDGPADAPLSFIANPSQ
ncbi:MAG: hypothetical protein VKP62_05845, partial [Candidatus Sericytochromatia bacterium]|nr:hypothetical protein [Candidatus Sericytochromatia bacterium]